MLPAYICVPRMTMKKSEEFPYLLMAQIGLQLQQDLPRYLHVSQW